MPKRWISIFLSAWLINAVVCFHPNDRIGMATVDPENGRVSITDDTLIGVIFNHFVNQDQQGNHDHKIVVKKRYLTNQSRGFNLQLPVSDIFHCINSARLLISFSNQRWENKIFLSPLHSFLFRLNPF